MIFKTISSKETLHPGQFIPPMIFLEERFPFNPLTGKLFLINFTGNLLMMSQKNPDGILQESFAYDRLDHLMFESFFNQFVYDSIGNCLSKNEQAHQINALNQLTTSTRITPFPIMPTGI